MTHVGSLVGGLCLAASFAGCEQPEEPAGDVDQPSPIDTQSQGALMTAPSKSPRAIAAMMFDITGAGGTTATGAPNATTIMNVVGGTGSSQRHMFQEISYGIQDTQPMYFGPYTLPVHNCLTIACCGPSSDQTGNGATVASEISALGMTFNHYFWVYGKIPSGANCGTWGDEGSPGKIATYSSYSFHDIVGYSQEIGHNFGMTHEPTMCCGGTVSQNRTCTGGTTFADSTTNCQHMEYANLLSFMGGGAHHPSAVHKYHQGWMSGCNLVKVGASTTITLLPQELPCNGAQLLQIPAPKTRPGPGLAGDRQGSAPMLTHYYLEMRAPYGFDSGIGPMVLVSIGPDLPATNRAAPYVYLLDTNPGTTTLNDAGLRAGASYSDPGGGLTITVNSIDMTSANVTITTTGTGSLTCGDNTAFTAPGPDPTSCGPLFGGGTSTGVGGSSGGAGGTAGRGGSTGSGGRGGTTGAAGAGGRGGTTGSAGAGGRGGSTSTGTGGSTTTGTGGATTTGSGGGTPTGTAGSIGPGTAGSPGPGTAGSTGTGTGGSSSPTGTGGSTVVTGTGGSGATTGTAGSGPGEAAGGCSCDTTSSGAGSSSALFGLALAMISFARRRPRRAPMD
jgi:MYXO-CTERM domain-containing protein